MVDYNIAGPVNRRLSNLLVIAALHMSFELEVSRN